MDKSLKKEVIFYSIIVVILITISVLNNMFWKIGKEDKKQENIRYELSYHYFFNKLISITQKDKKNQNNRIYSIIQIAFAKIEMLFFFDKLYYINYKKEDNVLLDLYNKMLIY